MPKRERDDDVVTVYSEVLVGDVGVVDDLLDWLEVACVIKQRQEKQAIKIKSLLI